MVVVVVSPQVLMWHMRILGWDGAGTLLFWNFTDTQAGLSPGMGALWDPSMRALVCLELAPEKKTWRKCPNGPGQELVIANSLGQMVW